MREAWVALRAEGSPTAREAIFRHYMEYARSVAAQTYAAGVHGSFEFQDYLQWAYVGLLESIDRFDLDRSIDFRTFCTHRIRGSILNGMERLSEIQQQLSFERRLRRDRLASLKLGLSRQPSEAVADLTMGLLVGFMLDGTAMYADEGLATEVPGAGYNSPNWQARGIMLQSTLALLPERSRKVIELHYFAYLPFGQIAKLMGVTAGRVSQLHREGLTQLREALQRRDGVNAKG